MSVIEIGRYPGRRDLQPGQISRIVIVHRSGAGRRVVLESNDLLESPNWTPDGKWLVVNCNGDLYRIPADGSDGMQMIDTGGEAWINNDHVLSPDGERVYYSAEGHLYEVSINGGKARRISNDHPPEKGYKYYLHGISPDGSTLAYVAVEPKGQDDMGYRYIALLPVAGGVDVPLTPREIPADGAEYSPDQQWIYFNSELSAKQPGHAQIFRMRPDGSDVEQLTFDERVNWFPHPAPNGREFIYLSHAPGTISHPSDLDVNIRVLPIDGGEPREIVALFGGQGTLNVNSWSPDSEYFAYIEYPPIGRSGGWDWDKLAYPHPSKAVTSA